MEKFILNGKLVDRSEGYVDVEDRGYQFGDGIYEVVRVYNGQLFTNKEHLDRLYLSAEKLSLQIPYSAEELTKQLQELVTVNQLNTGIIYMQFTRGTAPRKHQFPETSHSTFVAYTNEVERPIDHFEKGVSAILVDDIRWLRCDIKSLNLLGNVLAKQQAAEKGCYEAIQHRGEIVTEGSSSNIFIVKNNELLTHPATNLILKGITRQVILKICDEQQIAYREETFTIDDLLHADEVFMSSTTSEVTPIIQVDQQKIGNGMPGALTRQIQKYFDQEIEKQTKQVETTTEK